MSRHKENYLQESICRKLHTDNPQTLCAIVQNLITQYPTFCTSAYITVVWHHSLWQSTLLLIYHSTIINYQCHSAVNKLPLIGGQNLYIYITNFITQFILTEHTLSELARMRFCVSASGLRGWCVTVMGVAFSPASCATSKADINTGPTPDFNMLLTSTVSLSQLPSVVTRLGIPVTPPTSAGVRGLLSWSFAS